MEQTQESEARPTNGGGGMKGFIELPHPTGMFLRANSIDAFRSSNDGKAVFLWLHGQEFYYNIPFKDFKMLLKKAQNSEAKLPVKFVEFENLEGRKRAINTSLI